MHTYSLRPQRNYSDKLLIIISSFVLFASLVCLIINYSVDRSINWSLFPIGALIVLMITISPLLLMNKYRLPAFFAGLTISTILYLFLIQNLVPEKGWFLPLALPIAVLSLIAFGLSLAGFKLFKSNKVFAIAVTVFLFGVVVNSGVGLIVSNFMKGMDHKDGSRILTVGSSAIIAFVLMIAGYIKSKRIGSGDPAIRKINK